MQKWGGRIFSVKDFFFLHLPRKMELIEGSETLAFKSQTPGKYPKENIIQPYNNLSILFDIQTF